MFEERLSLSSLNPISLLLEKEGSGLRLNNLAVNFGHERFRKSFFN
jgi:hypothetical protein